MKTFIWTLSLLVLAQGAAQLSLSTLSSSQQAFQILGSAAGDQLGYSVVNAGDINGDGYDDILFGAHNKNSGRGAAYVIYGKPYLDFTNIDLSSMTLDPAINGFTITGAMSLSAFGQPLSNAGDVNKDGYDDIVISAKTEDSSRGVVYVIYGGSTATRQNIALASMDLNSLGLGFKIAGYAPGENLGWSVGSAGDVDGDGYADIIIGSIYANSGRGSAYVIYGGQSSALTDIFLQVTTLSAASRGFTIIGSASGDYLGSSVGGAGDINNDGFDDIIVGTPYVNSYQGEAYVIYGNIRSSLSDISLSSTSLSSVSKGFKLSGAAAGDFFANAVGTAGDIDGDGFDDILIGAPAKNSYQGEVYVIYGNTQSSLSDISFSSTTLNPGSSGFTIKGEAAADYLGYVVGGAGDLNNDGHDDILIGAPNKGAVYAIYGKPKASLNSIVLSPTAIDPALDGFAIIGLSASSYFGMAVSISGDFDGDGKCDLVIGAPADNSGAAYIVFPSKICADNCDTCTLPTTCDVCSTGYQLANPVISGVYCCPMGCNSCTSTTCQACDDGYYLSSGSCSSCLNECSKCSDGSTCTSCKSGYVKNGSQCVKCPEGTYANSNTDSCDACPGGCATCTSVLSCQSCQSGFYGSGGVCQSCPSECSECTDGSTCTSCSSGYVKDGSQCTPSGGGGNSCSQGTYLSGGNCLDCPEGCSECTSALRCQACYDGYSLSKFLYLCFDDNSRDKTIQDVADGTSIFVAAISFGSSLPIYFGIMARILRNTRYLNIQVSPQLQKAFHSWKPSLNSLAPKSWSSKSDSKTLPWMFERYDLEPVFLINYWIPFLMILIGFVLFVVFRVAEKTMKKHHQKTMKSSILRYLHVAASNFALTQLYMTFDDAIFYLVVDLRSSKFDGAFRVFSLILAIVISLVGVTFLFCHGYLIGKYQSLKEHKALRGIQVFREKCENVNLIFKDFKDTNLVTQSYLLIHLLRALSSSLVFVTLFEFPMLQISLLVLINLGAAVFLLINKPFANLFGFFSQLFCEIILFIELICMLIMAKYDEVDAHPVDTIERLGKCVIVLNLIMLIGSVIFMLISILKGFYMSYQERKRAQEPLKIFPKLQSNRVDMTQSEQSPGLQSKFRSQDSTSFIVQSNATSRNLLPDNSPSRIEISPKRGVKPNEGCESPPYRSRTSSLYQSQNLNSTTSSPELSFIGSPQKDFPGERARVRARARARSRVHHLREISELNK